MAKEKIIECPFYRFMWAFYSQNKKEIKKTYTNLTRTILANAEPRKDNPQAFLRQPQYEAFEMYVFLKEYLGSPRLVDLFDFWRRNYVPSTGSGSANKGSSSAIIQPIPFTFDNTRVYGEGLFNDLDYINRDTLEAFFKQLSDLEQDYSNYIFALTMGTGKTILMALCIFCNH